MILVRGGWPLALRPAEPLLVWADARSLPEGSLQQRPRLGDVDTRLTPGTRYRVAQAFTDL